MNNGNRQAGTGPTRWRFSLRALFVAVLLCSVVIGAAIARSQGKQRVIDRLEHLGAAISFDYQWSESGAWKPDARLPGNQVLQNVLGRHYAANLVEVQLFAGPLMTPDEFGDEDAAALASLPTIQWLVLQGTKLTDAGLLHLAEISSLERLDIEGTLVTEEGVNKFQTVRPKVKVAY